MSQVKLTIKFSKVIDFMLDYKAQKWEIPLNATIPHQKKKKKIPVILHEKKKIKDSEFLVAKKHFISFMHFISFILFSLSSPSPSPSPSPLLFLKGQFSILLY